MAVASFRACKLGSTDPSSNSGLSGGTGGHSLECTRRRDTANQKLLLVKERPGKHEWPLHLSPLAGRRVELALALSAKSTLRGSILGPRSILI